MRKNELDVKVGKKKSEAMEFYHKINSNELSKSFIELIINHLIK